MSERIRLGADRGDWAASATTINNLIDDLVRPTTEVARVIAAVAEGDLSQHMAWKSPASPSRANFNGSAPLSTAWSTSCPRSPTK